MNTHKTSLFFLIFLFIHIQAAENNNPVFINTISNCREIGWVADGTIIVNADQNNTPSIFSIKTTDKYRVDTLCTFTSPENAKALNSITVLDDQRLAFISLQDSSTIYSANGIPKTYPIKTQHRPTFLCIESFNKLIVEKLIIMDYNPDWMVKSTSTFDGKTLSPCENLNVAIKANDRPEYAFYNCITKSPIDNVFSLICEEGIYQWKPSDRNFTLIDPINDPTCVPLEFSTIVDELIYNCKGTLLAMTSEFTYSCFIYDLEKKTLTAFQNESDKQAVEKARQQYEQNPTHDNGRLLINAGWNSQYPMDSKEFHPTIPYVIATFLRSKAEVTYWNAKTAEIIVKQIVRQSMNQQNNDTANQYTYRPKNKALTFMHKNEKLDIKTAQNQTAVISNPHIRLISFDPLGHKIACAFKDGVVIVPVPQEILALLPSIII